MTHHTSLIIRSERWAPELRPYARRFAGALVTITPCRKLYLGGRVRVHHGLVGEVTVTLAALPFSLAARLALVVLGTVLVWDDRHDWPFPMRDQDPHTPPSLRYSRASNLGHHAQQ